MNQLPTPTILFDLDGTLLDPAGAITEGLSDAIAAHGFDRPSPENLRKFVGPSTDESLKKYTDVPEEHHREVLATYRAGYLDRARASSKLYPGMRELLESLAALPAIVGLATQKPQPTTETLMDDFDLRRYFDVVSGARDELKPETRDLPADKAGVIDRAFRLLEQRTEQDPRGESPDRSCSVMIGDREYDVAGAGSHGIACIGVTWGFGTKDELCDAGAVALVDDARQLREAIARETGLDALTESG